MANKPTRVARPTVANPEAAATAIEAVQQPEIAPVIEEPKRWLQMATSLSGPSISLSPGDSHAFCDAPSADGGPSEAQRLVDAGFAIDIDPPSNA